MVIQIASRMFFRSHSSRKSGKRRSFRFRDKFENRSLKKKKSKYNQVSFKGHRSWSDGASLSKRYEF